MSQCQVQLRNLCIQSFTHAVHLDKLYCAGVTDKGITFADACKPKELCPTFGKGMQAVIYFPYQQSFVNITHAHCTYIHNVGIQEDIANNPSI